MAYKIIVSKRALKEIDFGVEYYSFHSINISRNFLVSLSESYENLSLNPFHQIIYKNIRALKIKTFPFTLYFIIIEEKKIVRILSCFHNKLNPKKRP